MNYASHEKVRTTGLFRKIVGYYKKLKISYCIMTGICMRDVIHLSSGNILPLKSLNYIDYII